MLIVSGSPHPNPEAVSRTFEVRFHHVQAALGFGETVYWVQAEESSRPQSAISEIIDSELLPKLPSWLVDSNKKHFLVCGANMCCELVAEEVFDVIEHPSFNNAVVSAAAEYAR